MLNKPLNGQSHAEILKRLTGVLESDELNDVLAELSANLVKLQNEIAKCFSLANEPGMVFQEKVEEIKKKYTIQVNMAERIRLGGGCTHGADHGPECYLCIKERGRLTGKYVGFPDGLDVADYCFRYLNKYAKLKSSQRQYFLEVLDKKSATLKACDGTLKLIGETVSRLKAILQQKQQSLTASEKSKKSSQSYTTSNISEFYIRYLENTGDDQEAQTKEESFFSRNVIFNIENFSIKLSFRSSQDKNVRRIDIKDKTIFIYLSKNLDLVFFLEEVLLKLTGLKFKFNSFSSEGRIIDHSVYTLPDELSSINFLTSVNYSIEKFPNFVALYKQLDKHKEILGYRESKRMMIVSERIRNDSLKSIFLLNNANLVFNDIKICLTGLNHTKFLHPLKLNFSGNDLCSSDFYTALTQLAKSSVQIEELDLSYNFTHEALSEEVAEPEQLLDLLDVLLEYQTDYLRRVDLNSCGIELLYSHLIPFSEVIFALVMSSNHIQFIDLSHIYNLPIEESFQGHQFIEKIKLAVASSNTLKDFILEGIKGIDADEQFLHLQSSSE